MIIVPTDTPGFKLVRNIASWATRAGHASHGEMIYQACACRSRTGSAPRATGSSIAQERLGPGRIHHCMRWLGIAGGSFDMMCERANAREITPRARRWPTPDHPGLGGRARAEIDAARLQTLHAAWMIERHGARRRATRCRRSSSRRRHHDPGGR